jgi:hypothetical protein
MALLSYDALSLEAAGGLSKREARFLQRVAADVVGSVKNLQRA